jgi:DNA-binding winged helix-turn-helix (wHTH) protein
MTTEDVRIWRGQEIAFGNFRFYPEQRLLLCGDIPVSLGSRAREILVLLAERAGEVVKKGDLMARVWPDVFVEEGTLRVHIAALRKALGDGRDGLHYIENVTGRGYRLIAPVRRLGAPHPSLLNADQLADLHDGVPVPRTRIIGRTSAVAALARELPERRFVTIVGPGGIGKTTVAIAAAENLRALCPDGVRFVELASVTDPLLLAGTVASALGLATASDDPLPGIARFLEQKQMLVVLDNCEHVVEAAALLAEELLTRAAGLSVIATSREALRVVWIWAARAQAASTPVSQEAVSS